MNHKRPSITEKFHSNIITSDTLYVRHRRILSYALLLELIEDLDIKSIADVGCNRKVQSQLMMASGRNVTTIDFDPRWLPDVVASVEELPFKNDTFDSAICTQVLEHLPYEVFLDALLELCRVSSIAAIVSLPIFGRSVSAMGYLPFLGYYRFTIPLQFTKPLHVYDGDHYWEIGKRGYSMKKIRKDILSTGIEILREVRNPGNPYHLFLVLRK